MKTQNSLVLFFGWIAFFLTLAGAAQPADGSSTGVITGQVSNAATQTYLEGALVEVVGTNRSALTDSEGRYVISGVSPSDSAVLSVSFSGLDTQRIPIAVTSGQKVVRDVALNSGIYLMEKFTVAGEREGMARAEVLQRQASGVKVVISSDAFGNVADGNIAEMLQQVPGITTQYNGADPRGINMRGIGSELNMVTVDGQQVAQSAEGRVDRRFDFDQQALSNIESIEIFKAPTPDMQGASIGGNVNLITKSPFNRAGGRVISYSLGLTTQRYTRFKASKWKELIPGYGQTMDFSYSDILGKNRNLGVTVTLAYNNQQLADTTLLRQYENKNAPGPVYVNQVLTRFSILNRTRTATGVNLAYRWSDETTLMFNTAYNWTNKTGSDPAMTLNNARTLATLDASGNRTGGGPVNPNYADGITRIFPVAGNTVTLANSSSDTSGGTLMFQPKVRHRFANGLEIDYGVAFSSSDAVLDNTARNESGAPPGGSVSLTLANVGWTVDRSRDLLRPTVQQTAGPDWTNLNNYTGLNLNQGFTRQVDTIYNTVFDLKKKFDTRFPTYIKTGLTYNHHTRNRESAPVVFSYTGPDGVLGTADDNRDLVQFLDVTSPHLSDKDFRREYHNMGLTAPFPNINGIARHQTLHPELWKENYATSLQNKLLGTRKLTEIISAAYIMGNIQVGKVSFLTGMRVEETKTEGLGPLTYISPEEAARRAAWGTAPVTEAEAVRRAAAQYGNVRTNTGKYTNYFPGVHLKYEPFDGALLRGSWSTGVGRPTYGSIIPLDTANDTARTVNSSNPNLKPQLADSYEVSAEYYFKKGGLISASVFRKDIEDYIYTDNTQVISDGPNNGYGGQYAGYTLTTSRNRGTARVEGIEASYQQQLTFLPGWAKGFGLSGNFTGLRTKGDYGEGTVTTTGLPQFINRTGTLALTYRGFDLNLRLQASYRSRYLQADSTNPAQVQWRMPKVFWNWKSTYAVTKNVSLFFDVWNMFSAEVADIYYAYEDRPGNFHVNPARYTAGITGRF